MLDWVKIVNTVNDCKLIIYCVENQLNVSENDFVLKNIRLNKVHLFLKQCLYILQFIQNKVISRNLQDNPSLHQLKYLSLNQMKIVHNTVFKMNGH